MSLPESTAAILLRRFSNDATLEEAAKKLSKFTRLFKQYLAAIVGKFPLDPKTVIRVVA